MAVSESRRNATKIAVTAFSALVVIASGTGPERWLARILWMSLVGVAMYWFLVRPVFSTRRGGE